MTTTNCNLSTAVAVLVHVDFLAVVGEHALGALLGGVGELEVAQTVEQLAQMGRHLLGVVAVRQDVEQVRARHEVEPRECQTLRLQVLRQRLLTQRQT